MSEHGILCLTPFLLSVNDRSTLKINFRSPEFFFFTHVDFSLIFEIPFCRCSFISLPLLGKLSRSKKFRSNITVTNLYTTIEDSKGKGQRRKYVPLEFHNNIPSTIRSNSRLYMCGHIHTSLDRRQNGKRGWERGWG